jgi:hypothetical protein
MKEDLVEALVVDPSIFIYLFPYAYSVSIVHGGVKRSSIKIKNRIYSEVYIKDTSQWA